MFDIYEARKLLNLEILNSAKGSYAEIQQSSSAIRRNAENILTVSGIFLAASLSFFKDFFPNLDDINKILFCVVILCLFIAVIFSFLVLCVGRVPSSPPLEILRKEINFYKYSKDSSENDILNYSLSALNEISLIWEQLSQEYITKLNSKFFLIRVAQVFVIFFILLLILIIVRKLFLYVALRSCYV